MDSGRGEVMPLELAMKRELAYRKKVDRLLLQLHGGVSRENPVSSSSPRPSSGSKFSGIKRKAPTSSFNCQPRQMLQPVDHSNTLKTQRDDLFCKVCQVPCSGANSLKQHLLGQKHKDRLQNLTPSMNIGEEGAKQRLWCELCKIWCMNKNSFKDHLKGKKHQSRAQAMELHGTDGGEMANQMNKYCKVCKIWCMDAFNQHLESKRHILNLHAAKGKKMVLEDN
ncbi:hypothetical protein PVL29_022467 [Vitis rotundifolia]|uniref:C2H2-type domain-containing protein n=1 Tax=Vitis rotundifolia TaxID=103349 RepID=A0AA38YW21_VITRO|nr:hypothetical protein PVL29_022467 [Vitis rotundifolia]